MPDVGSFKGNVNLADLFGDHLNYGFGEISGERVVLSGSQMTIINIGRGMRLKTDLSLEVITDRGIFFNGAMETALDVKMVELSGQVYARGLLPTRLVEGKVDFGVAKLQAGLNSNTFT